MSAPLVDGAASAADPAHGPASRAATLQIKGLNQFYSGSHTLWDIDLTVPPGSCTCLMGRNGMGKTTLLRCIMGLLPMASGEINYDGTELRHLSLIHI